MDGITTFTYKGNQIMYIYNIPENTTTADRLVLQCLITEVLALGHKISVYEGEDYAVKRSTDFLEIVKGCASTGEDWLVIRDQDDKKLGTFHLIYDNHERSIEERYGDEAMQVIADYSNNDFSNNLYNEMDLAIMNHLKH